MLQAHLQQFVFRITRSVFYMVDQFLFCLPLYAGKTFQEIYKVRQFNSRNDPVKAKCAYLRTRGCCRLRNTLLVELCSAFHILSLQLLLLAFQAIQLL
ncbi:hypothetical protein B7P43_G07899 [Cryptotermes secundus]|uniref:Uncharacterized protein n=1 Tax=Cryptotermes secundus TaxID=105785 RepID=A0A2J7QTG6_9NEOP|nr:hypothetical protein B7P43_G07899 [Cryptotermes secundus]